MPLLLNTYKTSYRLAIWATSEPLEYFENKAHFTPYDMAIYEKIVNPTRKKEWLAVRVLLNETLGFWPQINYTESGKPLLQNHVRHLSISHTKEMVAILLCTTPYAGLDLERIDRNIDKVAQRFLSPTEMENIKSNKVENERIKYWCAKEAIFKAVNEQNVSFSKQIFVESDNESDSMVGHFYSENENIDFVLNSIELDNHFIVWTTESTIL
jgi:phosphopantetheinyl transferase (holo-ACP synthase)